MEKDKQIKELEDDFNRYGAAVEDLEKHDGPQDAILDLRQKQQRAAQALNMFTGPSTRIRMKKSFV